MHRYLFSGDRFRWLEIVFFGTYYWLFPIFSGLEYDLIEGKSVSLSVDSFIVHSIYGIKAVIPAVLCYNLLIKKFLLKRAYLHFSLGLIFYLLLLNLYIPFGYWLVSELSFLPSTITKTAAKWYAAETFIHFSIIYMIRELLVLTALAYFIQSARQENRIAELTNRQLESELAVLKSQVHPHFFFNTLNNIYALSLRQSQQAAPLIKGYSDIMRHLLYRSESPLIPLQDEIDFLGKYVEVESIRYPDSFRLTFEQQGLMENAMIEPMLFFPLVENAFKHGLSQETEGGFIFIIFSLMDNELSVEISNSISETRSDNLNMGMGLHNVKKRLELLYPNSHTFTISAGEDDFRILITIQIRFQ